MPYRQWFVAATRAVLLVLLAASPLSAAAPPPGDPEITAAVDAHLMRRLTADTFHAIDASTQHGVVTLTGQVRDLLAKRRAVATAGAIRGVRAVVDRIVVAPAPRPDAAIRADAVAALRLEPVTDTYEIAVDATGGVVTLRGTVQSAQERDVAERAVAAVPGVRSVTNELAVQYATLRSDAEIEADVRSRLRWDARIDARRVQVGVTNGTVVLSGEVGSVAERVLAVNDAWVNGVRVVTDRLRVVPTLAAAQRAPLPTPSDAEIRDAVVLAFALDPRVVSFNPVVAVRNGVVTLTGTVADLQARNAAEEDARNVTGVRFVNNYLKVRPLVARSDLAIAADVRQALRWNVSVDAAEVMVSVRSGIVTLAGTVDARYERQEAAEAAARVAGVVGVVNNLVLPAAWPVKSDSAIERDAEAGLVWNPFVDATEIDVSVANGVATLTGTAGSYADLVEAEREAFDAGATRVVNQLALDALPDGAVAPLPARVRSWWSGLLAELLTALIVASLFTVGLVWLLRARRAEARRSALVLFFLTVFLATWAAGVWISPRGPTAFGVPWLAFLALGLIVSLVAAAAPPLRDWRVPGAAGVPEPGRVTGPILWILLAMLVLAIVGNHVQERRAALPDPEPVRTGDLTGGDADAARRC